MATISKIQGALEPRLTGQVNWQTRPQPAETAPGDTPQAPRAQESYALDESQVRELVERMQASLADSMPDPHEVGFRQDPRTPGYVIEIKDSSGEIVKQFPPEKVLNLHRKLDELSGMVIDRMT